jgi:hypothetical protein
MKRFARTRSSKRASQPIFGRAQWSVGSIDDDGILYGLTTYAFTRSTIATAATIVTAQSTTTRIGSGSPRVSRSTGLREWCLGAGGSTCWECAGSGSEAPACGMSTGVVGQPDGSPSPVATGSCPPGSGAGRGLETSGSGDGSRSSTSLSGRS